MGSNSDGGTSVVAIVALIILAALAVLFFVYGLPMLQNATDEPKTTEIKLELPVPAPAPEPAAQ